MNKNVFTVNFPENDKPIIYATVLNEKNSTVESLTELVECWFDDSYPDDIPGHEEIKEIAHTIKKQGFCWFREELCFELTPVA